jgi:hypothetical protein
MIIQAKLLEAVVQDLLRGTVPHFLNAIAGSLLMLALPFSQRAVQVRRKDGYCDMHWEGMTRAWIGGYTLWNWVFIYLNFPIIAGQHLAVLGSAFIVGMIEPRCYLMVRGYTLAAALMLTFSFPAFLGDWMGTLHWSSVEGAQWSALVSLGFMVALSVISARAHLRNWVAAQSWRSLDGLCVASEE